MRCVSTAGDPLSLERRLRKRWSVFWSVGTLHELSGGGVPYQRMGGDQHLRSRLPGPSWLQCLCVFTAGSCSSGERRPLLLLRRVRRLLVLARGVMLEGSRLRAMPFEAAASRQCPDVGEQEPTAREGSLELARPPVGLCSTVRHWVWASSSKSRCSGAWAMAAPEVL